MLSEVSVFIKFIVPASLKKRARLVMEHGELSEFLRRKLEEEVIRREFLQKAG